MERSLLGRANATLSDSSNKGTNRDAPDSVSAAADAYPASVVTDAHRPKVDGPEVDSAFGQTPNCTDAPLSTLGSGSATEVLNQKFEAALKGIKEEFDDHRESINDSTNEIEANYELLCKLEAKVDRLQEQVEKFHLSLSRFLGDSSQELSALSISSIELDEREKEVFLVLYTASDQKPLAYREIAAAIRESEFLVRGYVTNMIEKGIPIVKRYINDVAYISLDKSFKDRQAKENIVKLSQRTVREFVV